MGPDRSVPTPPVLSDVANDFATPVFHVAMFGKSASTAQTFAGAKGIRLLTLIDRIFGVLFGFDIGRRRYAILAAFRC